MIISSEFPKRICVHLGGKIAVIFYFSFLSVIPELSRFFTCTHGNRCGRLAPALEDSMYCA